MDRPGGPLDHPDLGGTAELTGLTFTGQEAEVWRQQLTRWLGCADSIGHVQLRFVRSEEPAVFVTPTFTVPWAARTVPLAVGSLELLAYDASR